MKQKKQKNNVAAEPAKRTGTKKNDFTKRSVNTINVYIKIYRFEHNKEKGMSMKEMPK